MEDDYASMSSFFCNPSLMQWNKITNVVGYKDTAGITRCFQLCFVAHAAQPKFNRCLGVDPVLSQSYCQGVRLAILIQLDFYAAHSGSRLRDSLGMRRLGTQTVLLLDFGAYFLRIGQCI